MLPIPNCQPTDNIAIYNNLTTIECISRDLKLYLTLENGSKPINIRFCDNITGKICTDTIVKYDFKKLFKNGITDYKSIYEKMK